MDYEKKYKEALEKLRDFYRDYDTVSHLIDVKDELANLFPELKESDDERMLREIKRYIKEQGNKSTGLPNGTAAVADMLAWLEKQGDKDKLIKELGEYKVKYTQEVLEKHINSMSNKDDERLRKTTIAFLKDFAEQGYENAVECIDWLEKQGEQKPTLNFKAKDWYVSKVDGKIHNAKFIEKQGGEKPTDKVEPKFHEGDFIVNDYCSGKIIEITNDAYLLDTGQGIPFSYEHNAHLWTIKDAKKGDVLADKYGNIGIYQGDKNAVTWNSYCYCGINKEFYDKGSHEFPCYPATKEQRDVLFAKMKEAGYEWDTEKKELKKIFQRTISAEAKEAMYGKPANEEMKELLRTEYEKGRADAIAEMQKDWSKEDEERIKNIISVLDWDGAIGKKENPYQEEIDWLYSIKNRVQPKQELSEEDEDMIRYIGNAITCKESAKYLEEKGIDMIKAHRWLESFKPQLKQEWSEEDENRMKKVMHILSLDGRISNTELQSIYDWLKSLRPQKQWKPSDEQMCAFKQVYDWYNNNFAPSETLTSLYNDLKKLKGE